MIRLSDWKSPKDYDVYHGYLRLIFSMVDHREKNVTALKLNIAQCYYVDNEWILDWKYANSNIFEFLVEAFSLVTISKLFRKVIRSILILFSKDSNSLNASLLNSSRGSLAA